MYQGKKVSVILPTYNEKDSIRKVIQDFEATQIVDEIIVINNNAAEGTSAEVKNTTAIEIHEPKQGYGSAIQRGFKEATGHLIVVCEPDDTFVASDIFKLLSYSADMDIVYGSRTVAGLVWENANMGPFLRYGNWAVAKLLQVLFNTNSLSDVGCTFRLVKKEVVEKLAGQFKVQSNFFGPEMMVRGYLNKYKCIQIPLNYKERVGESSVTGNFKKAFILGNQMILLIIAMRFKMGFIFFRFFK
jgi:glycosyltransferase involved in cell wall biosynthesis